MSDDGDAASSGPSGGAPGQAPAQPLCDEARALVRADPSDSQGTHVEVVTLLRRALASGEDDAAGLLATAHLERGDRRAAAEVLGPAVHGAGQHAELAATLGETLAELGDHDGAEAAFLVGLDAGEPSAINDYGVFLRDRGRTQEAAYVLDRAARAGDDLAPLNLVALHLEELDDLVTAAAIAQEYADEARPSSLVALADVRLAEHRVDEAEQLYRRASELGAACAHIYYGWFLQDRRGDLAGAEDHLRRARDAAEPGAAFHLARFLHDTGRREEAQPLFEEAAHFGDADAQEVLETEYLGLVDRWDD